MIYQEYFPHPDLKHHIKCYWRMTVSDSPPSTSNYSFLNDNVEIYFDVSDPASMTAREPHLIDQQSCIYGPMTHTLKLQISRQIRIFGICFQPGSADFFTAYPASELTNNCLSMDDLWGAKGAVLVNNIQTECHSTQERIDFLNHCLLDCLDKKKNMNTHIASALQIIRTHHGQVTIDQLATLIGLSIRQLERLFKERVGLSPKQLCRSLRFKYLFKRLAAKSTTSWDTLAMDCGYYDQAHMINEFRFYTGTSPSIYFNHQPSNSKFFTENF